MSAPLLQAVDLSKRFSLRGSLFAPVQGWIEAVKQVNLSLRAGESVALVGESGSGKSTLARLLCSLLEPTSGSVHFHGQPIDGLSRESVRSFRRTVQFIFQDPTASLNPLMRIGQIIGEPLLIHRIARRRQLRDKVQTLFQEVGLDPSWMNRFPHMLSGGQRQRVGIARALALDPQLLICDEPVSSLDLSVQAQILRLLTDLQMRRGLCLFFISHNLSTVSAIADRVLVMKEGQIIEESGNPQLFTNPRHPYTRHLVNLAIQTI